MYKYKKVKIMVIGGVVLALSLSLLFPALAVAERATLLGWAVFPADTFLEGPTSGQYIGAGPFAGRIPPFKSKQPVGGISGIVPQEDGWFLAVSDNGFGSKAKSPDYLLVVYKLRPDFEKTGAVGKGTVEIGEIIRLRDPYRHINFSIQNENTPERYLTGADFDPESLQVAPDGTFWIVDEFGPFLFQTNSQGIVLGPPITLPGVKSPDNPFIKDEKEANLPRSPGPEGLALSVDGTRLYLMMEKVLVDSPHRDRLPIFEFDLRTREFTGKKWYYRMEDATHGIGDLVTIREEEFLVIERDVKEGKENKFHKIFKININRLDKEGFVYKEEVADLLNIADPKGISAHGRKGDIGLGETFKFCFICLEAVAIIAPDILVVADDNNYPTSTGRNPDQSDDNEFIKIRLAKWL